jgi:hypothetical protein
VSHRVRLPVAVGLLRGGILKLSSAYETNKELAAAALAERPSQARLIGSLQPYRAAPQMISAAGDRLCLTVFG